MNRIAVVLVASALALGGCASSTGQIETGSTTSSASTPTPTASTSSSPEPTATEPDGTTIEVTVAGKQVQPEPTTIAVSPLEEVTLVLTTDRAGELHIHAAEPELEIELKPGTDTHTFTAPKQPGVYEVELHDPDLLLFTIKVQ